MIQSRAVLMHLRPSLCARPVRTEHRARVLNWALSHLFLFACLNCDLNLFVQMQDDMKESSVRSCCPWDMALCVCTEHGARVGHSVQLFRVLCLNALNSFECLNWQGWKTHANDKLSWLSSPSSVLSVFLGRPQPVGWDRLWPPLSRGPL